jgi:hypothetical protein
MKAITGTCLHVITVIYLVIVFGLSYAQGQLLLWLGVVPAYPITLYCLTTVLFAVENFLLLQDLDKQAKPAPSPEPRAAIPEPRAAIPEPRASSPEPRASSPREDRYLINAIITQNFELRLENTLLLKERKPIPTVCTQCKKFIHKSKSHNELSYRRLKKGGSHDSYDMTAM